ncbi:MAG: EMC3/TMCO1 family protein [archaeon]|nr:EMC3/TMCO1 family protein [archaeon]
MANPGSPEQMRESQQQNMQPMPTSTLVGMMATLLIMMVVVSFRSEIGGALNVVFQYVDFNGEYPVLTLVIAGLIMITLSTTVRSLLSDPIAMAKSQHLQSEYNAEMRKARTENNLYKLKKLQDLQPQMMSASMEQSTKQMKLMPVTMVFVIPIYAWIWFFVSNTVSPEMLIINMPWGDANLNDMLLNFMPVWIIIYTLISLPIGQLENKIINFFLFKRRLAKLDKGEA